VVRPRSAIATLLFLLLASSPARADDAVTPRARYEQQKKSVALAVTLEAICPIAGAGAFYAGETDKGTLLAVMSAVSAGVAVGSAFYLIHLDHQDPSGSVDRVFSDIQSGAAWTGLVLGSLFYLLTRVSGLSLAPDAVGAFNVNLQQQLGVSPTEPTVPFHAQVTGASLTWRF
jgi:hypothetical protein